MSPFTRDTYIDADIKPRKIVAFYDFDILLPGQSRVVVQVDPLT